MTKLTLTNCVQGYATLVENEFIDKYMAEANGEYVKVYLLLLRYKCDPSVNLGVSEIADILDCTEKDVNRALDYWTKKGLLDVAKSGAQSAPQAQEREVAATPAKKAAQTVLSRMKKPESPVTAEPKSAQTPSEKNRKEFREITHVTELYLGKTLTKTEVEELVYFYDVLGMSADLIEYLIEYCVENGHKSIHYIKKVALSWNDQHVTTVKEAKDASGKYNKNSYAVLNAYGIKGRAPAEPEMAYISRWNDEYGFSPELIVEACNRTMNTIHQPSFDYTESILKSWMDKGVRDIADVKALDLVHMKEKEAKKTAAPRTSSRTARSKFNNFEGRKYQDMDELTRKLIETR